MQSVYSVGGALGSYGFAKSCLYLESCLFGGKSLASDIQDNLRVGGSHPYCVFRR